MDTISCPVCRGARWVCEDHPNLPWKHDGCGGAGIPCVCNPNAEVTWDRVIATNEEPDGPLQ